VNSVTDYFSVLNDLKPFADFIIKSENTSDYYHYYYQCSATHNTHGLLENVGRAVPIENATNISPNDWHSPPYAQN